MLGTLPYSPTALAAFSQNSDGDTATVIVTFMGVRKQSTTTSARRWRVTGAPAVFQHASQGAGHARKVSAAVTDLFALPVVKLTCPLRV